MSLFFFALIVFLSEGILLSVLLRALLKTIKTNHGKKLMLWQVAAHVKINKCSLK
jgi:hypothetical protein